MCFPARMSAAMILMVAALSHAAEGDPAGKRKTVTCNACHGQSGFKSMPKLGGQSAELAAWYSAQKGLSVK